VMKKSGEISAIALPIGGTGELKRFIKRNTVEGHLLTLAIISLLIVLYIIVAGQLKKETSIGVLLPKADITIIPPLGPVIEKPIDLPQLPGQVIEGMKEVSGKPIAVSESDIVGEPVVFTTFDKNGVSRSVPGTGENNPAVNNTETQSVLNKFPLVNENDDVEFKAVEQEPYTDLSELQRSVIYPELAKRIQVEGKVVVSVYVSRDGKAIKSKIDYSDNELLNEAAQRAVMQAKFTPAIQNKIAIDCWISIPITFRLR
ncbi:MAG: energy transducer TonB, partial [Bacteroidota bacterium]